MKIKSGVIAFSFALSLMACDNSNQEVKEEKEVVVNTPIEVELTEAEQLIANSIETHGGDLYKSAYYSFIFREKKYSFKNSETGYQYEMKEKDDKGNKHHYIIENGDFYYRVNKVETTLPEEDREKKINAINSVIYFVMLPYKLQDASVNVDYKGQTFVKDVAYQLVKVTFNENGGGKDFQDEYAYWLNESSNEVDYIAYSFIENKGGTRFRKAINKRKVDGILFQDYINYKGDKDMSIFQLAEQFEKGELEELSRIVTENVKAIE